MTVYHAGNHDVVVDDREVQGVGKVRDQSAPLVSVNCRKAKWKLTKPFDGCIDRASKPLPQLRLALFEPPFGLKQFALGGRPEDYLAGH